MQRSSEVEEAFRVMHNWRFHHAYPMVRERAKLNKLAKETGGFTSGRVKRISSIRKKLARSTVELHQMQDLVGCRAILPTMDDLREVLSRYHSEETGGNVCRKTDYIAK
ncbi:MAG: RelA/SpoT domain-containing protein [Hyphomicrobiales bacterium]